MGASAILAAQVRHPPAYDPDPEVNRILTYLHALGVIEQQEALGAPAASKMLPPKVYVREWMRIQRELAVFNRRAEKDRKRQHDRARRANPEVYRLRSQCYCRNCLEYSRAKFAPYYVPRLISFECFLERWQTDRDAARKLDPGLVSHLEELEHPRNKYRSVHFPARFSEGHFSKLRRIRH